MLILFKTVKKKVLTLQIYFMNIFIKLRVDILLYLAILNYSMKL